MMLSGLLLALFFESTTAFYFEIDGHYTAVTVSNIQTTSVHRSHFLPAEQKLRQKLVEIFQGDIDEFYVQSFSIHGEQFHPSAIFTAYLSTSLSHSEIVHLVSQDDSLDFFRVRQLAALPPVPENLSMDEAVTSCRNGGFLMPNNSCACPAFFTGDRCETVNCLNGGIADQGRCSCPPGAYAINCQQRGCLPPVDANLDFFQNTFILVVNQKSTMSFVLDRLANLLGPLLADSFADSRYDSYIVVNYVHTKNAVQITKNVFKHFYELSNYLNSLVYSIQGLPEQPTQRAVLEAQSFYPLMRAFSDIYVFLDSLDEDATPANYSLSHKSIENQLILQSLAWRNRINYYFSESSVDYSKSGNGYDTFYRVAKATLGDVYTYPLAEAAAVINTIETYSKCQTLAAVYDVTNQLNLDLSIPGGQEQQSILVYLTVATGTLPKVTDGSRKQMNVLMSGARFEIYETTSANKQVIIHPGGQRVSVRACIGSPETMIISSGHNPDTDVGDVFLSASYSNYLTGLAVGTTDTIAEVEWISLQTQQTENTLKAGEPRSAECTHNIAFDVMEACTPGPLGQLVQVISNAGDRRSRLVPGYCVVMDKPPSTGFQCFNGGTRLGVKTCKCVPEWEGPQCNIPVCKNGGKVNNFPGNGFGLCNCAPGFSGDHCTILNCTVSPAGIVPPPTTTLAVVIQSSLSQALVGANVDSGVADLLKSMQGKDEYDQFVLTTFSFERTSVGTEDVIRTSTFTDPAEFQTAVNTVKYLPTPSNIQDPLAALSATFKNNTFYNSALFLFVDAQPKETSSLPEVLMMAVERNVPINVVVTPPFGLLAQCIPIADQLFYGQLATKSGGIYLNLCQTTALVYTTDPVYSLFVAYAASHHRTESINQVFTVDFAEKPSLFFQSDQPNNDVYVIVNCPKTENVDTAIENHELGYAPPVASVVQMPFLAVYKAPTTAVNALGYTVTVKKGFASSDGPCNIQAVIKSKHAAYLRFSPNPSFDARQQTIDFAVPTFPVVHIVNPKLNRTYGPTLTATDDIGGFGYEGYALDRTNSCVYEYYFAKEFTCTKPADSFVHRFSGMTTDGHTYLRSLRGYCFLETGLCANGGYKLSNGLCKCPPNFGGVYCQSPKCQNGFPLNTNDFECMCGVKHTGRFCETPVCNDWNYMESVDPRSSRPRQVTFVLNKNVDSLLVNVQLSGIIQAIVDATEMQDVPVMYSLILYDQFEVDRVVSTAHADQFVQYFQYAVNNNIQKESALATKSVDALGEAYKLNIQAPGIIYLFMGSPTVAPSPGWVDNYLEQKINTQVNVFYTPQKSGNYPHLPTDPQTSILIQAVKQSAGRYLPLTQNSVTQMTQMLVSSTQTKDLVYENGLSACTIQTYLCVYSFDLESQFNAVELTIAGIDVAVPGYVSVQDGQKRVLPLTGDNVLFKDNQVLVLRFNSSQAAGGQWKVQLTTGYGPSTIQVHVDSAIRLFPGFTIDPFDDFVHQLPFTGLGLNRSTYMTFRVTDPSVVLNKVNTYRAYFNSAENEGSSEGSLILTRRDASSCAYQYVSSEWIVDLSAQQKFVVTGTDAAGTAFTRTFFYEFPLYNQRAATCLHGTHDPYGQCLCSDKTKWSGDYCQNPVCHNGGTPSYGICICQNGYYGNFCELVVS